MPQVRKRTSVKKTPPKLKRENFPYLKDFPTLHSPIADGKLRVPSPKKKMESPYIKEFGKHKKEEEELVLDFHEKDMKEVEEKPRAYSPNKVAKPKKAKKKMENVDKLKKKVENMENMENVNYFQYTIKELKEMLKKRKLKISGNKSILVERLMEDDLYSNPKMDNPQRGGLVRDNPKMDKTKSKSGEKVVETNWNAYKVVELKELLKKKGLPRTGNKATLIKRLENEDGVKGTKIVDENKKSSKTKKNEEIYGKVMNPDTGRMIAVGGATYKKLVKEGKI